MTALSAWLRLPPPQRAMALEAAAWLTLARFLVRRVPMRYWHSHLHPATEGGGRRPLGRAVGRTVRRVAHRLPFESDCLPKAMAVQWMLRRRRLPGRLWIGVRRSAPQRSVAYHAWVTVDDEAVIGGHPAGTYVPLPWPPPPGPRGIRP